MKSLKSETDDGLLSCSNFPERPTLEVLQVDKPVLPEIKHLRGKINNGRTARGDQGCARLESGSFSKHKADIGCCNFVEHEIELEESAVPHREGVRRMTPNKSDACRKEIGTLLEYDTDNTLTLTLVSGHPWREEKPPCRKQVQGGARKRASRIRRGRKHG